MLNKDPDSQLGVQRGKLMKHVYKQEGREAGRKHGRIGRKKGLEERKDWKEERIGRKGGTDRRTEEEGEERNGAKEGV